MYRSDRTYRLLLHPDYWILLLLMLEILPLDLRNLNLLQ
jgi:hypothetical protein